MHRSRSRRTGTVVGRSHSRLAKRASSLGGARRSYIDEAICIYAYVYIRRLYVYICIASCICTYMHEAICTCMTVYVGARGYI